MREIEEACNIEEGTSVLNKTNLPMKKGDPSISLERQVRIAAGLLVFLGTLTGLTVSTWYFIITLFVGTGLAFSGITNTCGMAVVLTKCPWNRS